MAQVGRLAGGQVGTLGHGLAVEGEAVAGGQGAAVVAAEGAADIGRPAAEHGRDIEAALDREIGGGAVGQRRHPEPRTTRDGHGTAGRDHG